MDWQTSVAIIVVGVAGCTFLWQISRGFFESATSSGCSAGCQQCPHQTIGPTQLIQLTDAAGHLSSGARRPTD